MGACRIAAIVRHILNQVSSSSQSSRLSIRSKHCAGLELGIFAILVEHQVRGAVDVQVREHRTFLRHHNITHEKGRLDKGRVITIGSNLKY